MGCWGYKEIQSDNGLDRMSGSPSFLSWAMSNNNILDVDQCLKDGENEYRSNPYYKGSEEIAIKDDVFAMSEILYHFVNNTVLAGLGRLNIRYSYGWADVTKVTASKEMLNHLASRLYSYLNIDMKRFETSGWVNEDVYKKRYDWIEKIAQLLTDVVNKSSDNPVTIYDKSTADPELIIYDHNINITEDHELNRLRLFLANEINHYFRFINQNPRYHFRVYYEVITRKNVKGQKYYALVLHGKNGKQKTVAKGMSADLLIQNAVASEIEQEIGEFEMYIWNLKYNETDYKRYCRYLQMVCK